MRTRRESFRFQRDVEAQRIPSGDVTQLAEGQLAEISQELGRSFTVLVNGVLFRVDGADADALGRDPPQRRVFPDAPSDDEIEPLVWSELREVYDPEIPCNIVELGLIYACDVHKDQGEDFSVRIRMTVTAPGCGMGEQIAQEVADRLDVIPRVADYTIDLVFDPPWDRLMLSMSAKVQLGLL